MTRKDYIALAQALSNSKPSGHSKPTDSRVLRAYECQHELDAESIADALAAENPRFDRARFLAACGVQEG